MKPTFYNPFDKLLKDSLRDLEERQKRESAEEEKAEEQAVTVKIEPTPRVPAPPRGTPNVDGLACSVCGGIPERLRTDGISASRHFPKDPGAKRYRDTEFCDGQGRPVIGKKVGA